MELNDFLYLTDSIATSIKPLSGMTGSTECDDCDAISVLNAIKILKTINQDFIISHKGKPNAKR